MPARQDQRYYGFKVIGSLKLVSGVIAIVVGIGTRSLPRS